MSCTSIFIIFAFPSKYGLFKQLMNRLNKTEPTVFLYCGLSLVLKDSFYRLFKPKMYADVQICIFAVNFHTRLFHLLHQNTTPFTNILQFSDYFLVVHCEWCFLRLVWNPKLVANHLSFRLYLPSSTVLQ